MNNQTMLFDVGPRLNVPPKTCTPAPIGSGPSGATCGTCWHKQRVHYHTRFYLKCGLMEHAWTHGPGSDIRAKWPACREYELSVIGSPLSETEKGNP